MLKSIRNRQTACTDCRCVPMWIFIFTSDRDLAQGLKLVARPGLRCINLHHHQHQHRWSASPTHFPILSLDIGKYCGLGPVDHNKYAIQWNRAIRFYLQHCIARELLDSCLSSLIFWRQPTLVGYPCNKISDCPGRNIQVQVQYWFF